MSKRKIRVVCGKRRKTITIGGEPRKITIFKLGDKKRGWIPNNKHFDKFNELLRGVIKGETDILVFHFGVEVQQITL